MANYKPIFEPSKLVEKYRWPIGLGLLVLILCLGGYLLWRENFWKAGEQDKVASYEAKIGELEDRVAELEKTKGELSNNQTTNQLTTDSGKVAGASAASAQPISEKVNLNTATAAELDTLSGIGPAYAGRIIDYRSANGGFKSIDEVKNVKGIGDKTFDKFKDRITI